MHRRRKTLFVPWRLAAEPRRGVDTFAARVLQEERFFFSSQIGPVAQLGARMTGSHEVEGSNPSRSTKLFIPTGK